ncbi:Uncharacterised protein [Mycobacteroides abscessus subsp. abscessus]|nr:Uncharacterised protein [Mycobacteroides abscessus subsp. abscessus]
MAKKGSTTFANRSRFFNDALGVAASEGIADRRTRNMATIEPSRARPAKGMSRSAHR